MKILFTGSHFTPAQAVIEELKSDLDLELVYVGRKSTREGDNTNSVELNVLPKLGVKFIPITTGRLQRFISFQMFFPLLKLPVGFFQAGYILIKEKPDLIVSFGGYIAVPVVIIGWLFSIPVIVHEQTIILGLAGSISRIFADKVALSFENSKLRKGSKYILTGNPIRNGLLQNQGKSTEVDRIVKIGKHSKLPIILISGGNQGSHLINETVEQILPELLKYAIVVHQTGDSKFNDFEKLENLKKSLDKKERYFPKKWIDVSEWAMLLQKADLSINRAGINTLLELSLFQVPSLTIPIPYIYKDEQNVNAKYFKELGLVQILLQKDLSPKSLFDLIKKSINNLSALKLNAKNAKKVVVENAAKKLALEIRLQIKDA